MPAAVCGEMSPCCKKSLNLICENVDDPVAAPFTGVGARGVADGVVTVLALLSGVPMAAGAWKAGGAVDAAPPAPFGCAGPLGLRWRLCGCGRRFCGPPEPPFCCCWCGADILDVV